MSKLSKNSLIFTGALGLSYVAALFLPKYFIYEVITLTITIVFAWRVFFEVKPNKQSIIEKMRFLTLPLIFNLGALYLTTIFFQVPAKGVISVLAVITNYYLWISLRKVYNLSEKAAIFNRNILIIISFISVYLGSTIFFRLYMLFSTSTSRSTYQLLLVIFVFGLFYIISSFLTWSNGSIDNQKKLRPYNVIISLLGAEAAWVSSIWIVNYPVIATQEKATLGGSPLPAVLLTIIFYFLWGIIFHKLDHSLTKKVLTEYILISIIFIIVLLSTARWLPTL